MGVEVLDLWLIVGDGIFTLHFVDHMLRGENLSCEAVPHRHVEKLFKGAEKWECKTKHSVPFKENSERHITLGISSGRVNSTKPELTIEAEM
jgi:hypothetical protein